MEYPQHLKELHLFGKYKGKKLGDIISSDKEYLKYIVTNSKDIKIINACKYLMKLENVV